MMLKPEAPSTDALALESVRQLAAQGLFEAASNGQLRAALKAAVVVGPNVTPNVIDGNAVMELSSIDDSGNFGSENASGPAICSQISSTSADDAACHLIGTPTQEDSRIKEYGEWHVGNDDCSVVARDGQLKADLGGYATEDPSASDMLLLDKLRKQAGLRFASAAKSNQLHSALQTASNPAVSQPAQQKEDVQNAAMTNFDDEDVLPADLPVLDRLRKEAAVQFWTAAKTDKLSAALQIVSNSPAKTAMNVATKVQQNDDTQDVVVTLTCNSDNVAESEETAACLSQDRIISHNAENNGLIQQLRQRASLGMAVAAQDGSLSTILQTSKATPAPEHARIISHNAENDGLIQKLRQRASLGIAVAAQNGSLRTILQASRATEAPESSTPRTLPSRTPSKTPKLPRTPSVTSISQGGCGTLGRHMVPAPTGLPTPSGEYMCRSPAGHPGGFRRRHSRTSSKILG